MNQPQKRQNGTLDGQIDQVLAHLHNAQPDAGLNDRLLQRLTQIAHSEQIARRKQIVISTEGAAAVERPAVASQSHTAPDTANTRLRFVLPPQPKFFWPLALSGTAAVVLATLALQPRHRLSPAHPQHPQHTKGAASTDLPSRLPPNPAKAERSSATQLLFSAPRPSIVPHKPTRPPHLVTVATEHPAPPTAEEAKALDDLHAPSQPAPPLPLTAQERVLVRMLRRGSSIELAQLAPDWLNAFRNREKADFENFFDPPPLPQLDKPENSPLPNLLPPTPLVSSPSPSSPQLGEQSK